MAILQYYFVKKNIIEHVIFNKYTIENGIIRNKKGEPIKYHQNTKKYNKCNIKSNCGKRYSLLIGRAIASSIYGPPPTSSHTADHIDRNPENDTDDNIRWATKLEQNTNQDRSKIFKTAFVIIKDTIEKTAKEWNKYLKNNKNSFGNNYSIRMINQYARRKQHGFSYKEYPDLPNEIWKKIIDSKNKIGYWEVSDMNRVKYVTKHAENVLSDDRFGLLNGYPTININGKQWYCHILAFMTFFPEEYANKTLGEMILHKNDDKMDFRPHKLRIGTQSENCIDAHNNGKHAGNKHARIKCASYIDGIFEKDYESQSEAVRYLKAKGYDTASHSNIGKVLNEDRKTAYGRTWKLVD